MDTVYKIVLGTFFILSGSWVTNKNLKNLLSVSL